MGTPPQEAEENTGMQRYYLITFLMFSSLSGYCASFYSAYNSQTCIANDQSPASKKAAEKKRQRGPSMGLRNLLNENIEQSSLQVQSLNQQQKSSSIKKINQFIRNTSDQYFQKMKKAASSRRQLSHLTPSEIVALEGLNAQLVKEKNQTANNEYILVEGASQTGNAFGMTIFYAIQAFLSLMIYLGMLCFSKYLPTEIPNLHICVRLYGGLVRKFMFLQVVLHYVTLVQVVLLWLGSLNQECVYNADFSVLAGGGKLTESQAAGEAAAVLLQVTGVMWFLMHCIGGVIRSLVHIEPLYEQPLDPEASEVMVILFQRCGP